MINVVPISSNMTSAIKPFEWMTDPVSGASRQKLSETGDTNAASFGDIFKQLIDEVNRTDYQSKVDAEKIATGTLDNPAEMIINAQKAALSLQMVTEVRKHVLDAYNEVMRITL